MLGPGFVEIAGDLSVSVNEISQATSYLVLACGLGLFISNPLAKCYGKRPVYLAAGLVLFAASVWGAATTSYGSFLGSRLVGGLGMGPYEVCLSFILYILYIFILTWKVLVQCTIGDMYFVHERATRLAFWGLFLTAGISAGPVVSGYIIEYAGYRWTFGACAIFFAVLTVAFFFLAPETAFIRADPSPETTSIAHEAKDKPSSDNVHGIERIESKSQPQQSNYTPPAQKHSYWRSLRIYSGRYSDAPLLKVVSRPFILYACQYLTSQCYSY